MAQGPRPRPRPRTGQTKRELFDQLGRSGLVEVSGIITDEWSTKLQGVRGRRSLREFADEDWTAGAILYALEMLVRQVHWTVEPKDDSSAAVALATFVDGCRSDMEESWPDTLAEILTMLVYGWSYLECVFKSRQGPGEDPTKNSKFRDGRVGWRSWAIRSQESLLRWEFADDGALLGMWQIPPPDYKLRFVPYSKSLLFRPTVRRQNPEGRPLLRNAFASYYKKKGLEAIEAIGAERDLAGYPVMRVPDTIVNPQTPEDQAASDAYYKALTNIRRDEAMGLMLPSTRDDKGNYLYDLQLLSTGGSRQIDTNSIIVRHSTAIAQTVLADWMMLGHNQRGAQALSTSKVELFNTALVSILDVICAVANDRAIAWLVALNGEDPDRAPTLAHGQVERSDTAALGQFVLALSQAGADLNMLRGSPLLNRLLEEAHLPTDDPLPGGQTPDAQQNGHQPTPPSGTLPDQQEAALQPAGAGKRQQAGTRPQGTATLQRPRGAGGST